MIQGGFLNGVSRMTQQDFTKPVYNYCQAGEACASEAFQIRIPKRETPILRPMFFQPEKGHTKIGMNHWDAFFQTISPISPNFGVPRTWLCISLPFSRFLVKEVAGMAIPLVPRAPGQVQQGSAGPRRTFFSPRSIQGNSHAGFSTWARSVNVL